MISISCQIKRNVMWHCKIILFFSLPEQLQKLNTRFLSNTSLTMIMLNKSFLLSLSLSLYYSSSVNLYCHSICAISSYQSCQLRDEFDVINWT